jgi:hypothetical protein
VALRPVGLVAGPPEHAAVLPARALQGSVEVVDDDGHLGGPEGVTQMGRPGHDENLFDEG